ncbi:MAG TPA: 1-phosphofructokinase family hexose kinase [Solirubrobacterales bacterium]|jgi:1-phosphofructokinase/tagatose 6-phosphate kinase|nr:1-phosphofructokinase family hexose kinase [Solirubrobacterales bacterium]
MIITVTLNAAIDNTLAVPHFRLGARHRAVEKHAAAGGKGINVARALKSLGQPVIATGFAGGVTGTRIIEYLTGESVLNDFVRIGDESRTSTVVIDPTNGDQTEINERGPSVTEAELDLFREKLFYLARGADICVIAGSIPRGIPADFYAELITELRKANVVTVLDADGEVMSRGIKAEPDLVTPNMVEAEELVGREFIDDEDFALAPSELRNLGAHDAIVTTGDGAWVVLDDDPDNTLRVTAPAQDPISTVGSGDALVAGFVTARYIGLESEAALRYAVACGAESTQHFGAGTLDRDAVDHLIDKVEISMVGRPVVG